LIAGKALSGAGRDTKEVGNVTLDQLRIFVAVAERLHVTRAAEELGLTQSGASAAIAALETHYGTELFYRVGRRIELTEGGRIFLDGAKAVLAQVAIAERTLSELSAMERGTLSIHASQTVANYWLPARVGEFHRLYPGVELRIEIGNTSQVAAAVLKGAADLGFVEGPVDDPALEKQDVPGDKLVLVHAAGYPVSRRDKINLADLRSIRWVLREKGSGTRQIFEDAVRAAGVDPSTLNVVLELPSNESVLMAVETGIGSSVMSNFVAERTRLRAIDLGLKPRMYSALRHRKRSASEAQKALLAIVNRLPAIKKLARSAVA
jgi:DNA-binding transcriptional LysR family regulator